MKKKILDLAPKGAKLLLPEHPWRKNSLFDKDLRAKEQGKKVFDTNERNLRWWNNWKPNEWKPYPYRVCETTSESHHDKD